MFPMEKSSISSEIHIIYPMYMLCLKKINFYVLSFGINHNPKNIN